MFISEVVAFELLGMIAIAALVQAPPIGTGNSLRVIQIKDVAPGG